MTQFRYCFEAEVRKAQNSLAFWLSFLGTSGIIIAFFGILLLGTENFLPTEDESPWKNFFMVYYEGTAFMLLPLFAIITAALVCYVEYSNGMWKQLLISTASRTHIYLSKLLLTYLMIIAAHLYFIILMLLSGLLLGFLRPELQLYQSFPDLLFLGKLAYKTILSVGSMLAIQFWISMRFRSFIVALGAGVIGFVLSSLLVDSWAHSTYLPYTYPLLYLKPEHLHTGLSTIEIYNIVLFLLCTLFGLIDFQKITIKT